MKIPRNIKSLLTLAAIAAFSLHMGNAQTYNLNTDFSTLSNPMGPGSVWSLARFDNTLLTGVNNPFSLNTVFTSSNPTLQVVVGNHQAWTNSTPVAGTNGAYNSSIYKKVAGGTQLSPTDQPANTLGVVTNNGGTFRPSILFTAPATGLYRVTDVSAWRSYNFDLASQPGRDLTAILFRIPANFSTISAVIADKIDANSTSAAPESFTSRFQTALGDTGAGVNLIQGDKLVFQFQDDGSEAFAGFNYSVTAVPEPSTWLGAGLITGLVVWSQRKRFVGSVNCAS